jgi:uncharacterized membrane protein
VTEWPQGGLEASEYRRDIPAAQPSPPAAPAARGGVLGLTTRQAAMLAWAGGWFTGAIMLWLDPADRFVRVHALQSLLALGGLTLLALVSWSVGLMMAFLTPSLFRVLTWLSTAVWLALVPVWIAGLVQAARGRRLPLPVVSVWADRLTSRHSTLPAPQHLL